MRAGFLVMMRIYIYVYEATLPCIITEVGLVNLQWAVVQT